MSLIGLIVVLALVGFALWLINTMIPMDPKIKTVINAIVVVAICLWLLQSFGLLGPIGEIRIR